MCSKWIIKFLILLLICSLARVVFAIGNTVNTSDVGDYLYEGHLGTSFANPHAATNVGGVDYVYDENGNLVSDGVWSHTWDYNNRLIQSTNGSKTISYGYDTSGNRVKKSDGTKTTYYFDELYDVEDGVVKKHIYSAGGKVATIDDGVIVYHHTDHLSGSNVESNADGDMVEVIDYFPFGSVRVDESYGGFENDYKYTGKELDEDTGLYYYGARYYDAGVGRFVSVDPLGGDLIDPQSLNKYSYVRNNPLKYVDPTGETGIIAFILGMGTVATAYGPEIASTVFGGISTAGALAGLKEAVDNQIGMVDAYLNNDAEGVQEKAGAQKKTFFKQLAGQLSNLIIGTLLSPTKSDDQITTQTGKKTDDTIWKPGDPINKNTKNGYPSWSTVRRRYWINESLNNSNDYTSDQLDRMQDGLAPKTPDGQSIELHHIQGRNIPDPHNQSNLQKVTPEEHADIDPFRHTKKGGGTP